MRLLSLAQHEGQNFVQYTNNQAVAQIAHPTEQLYEKVKSVLSEYYFYLRETKEILFFSDLPILRTLVCLCCCLNMIMDKLKGFLRKVEMITNLEIKSMDEFHQMLNVFT